MIETRAPGKLFIAGEYAVVEPHEPAVIVAVDRFIRVQVTPGMAYSATNHTPHVAAAIDTVEQVRRERGLTQQHYDIVIQSELENEHGIKFGLGSSAAVTVALIDALSSLYDLGLSALERFKLSLLATITIAPRASGGDLAASTFGGWLRYASPDRAVLATDFAAHGASQALTSDGWHGLEVRRLTSPRGCELLVGWTGSPASTEQLVNGVVQRSAAHTPVAQSTAQRQNFLAASRNIVNTITTALESQPESTTSSPLEICTAVRRSRALLQRLGEETGTLIETPKLAALCEIAERHGAAAKPSGAGGGDCGIVLTTVASDRTAIEHDWSQQDIVRLDLAVHEVAHSLEGGSDER